MKNSLRGLKADLSKRNKESVNFKISHLRLSSLWNNNKKELRKINKDSETMKHTNICIKSKKQRRERKGQTEYLRNNDKKTPQIWWKTFVCIFKKLNKIQVDKIKENHT